MKNLEYGLQVLSLCQGVWVLTLMGFLMWHYMYRSIKNRVLERNALAMGLSYSLLTGATMITALNNTHNTVWQIIVIIGYAFGDYAIYKMVRHVHKNQSTVSNAKREANISDEEFKRLRKQMRDKNK